MTLVIFNLIANATFSLACGLLVVGLFLWIFRVGTGPGKIFLLSLPFMKIVYDFLRGLPQDSVLFTGIDPFSLPPKHQIIMAGAGLSPWGPILNVVFAVKDLSGKKYAASVGDYFAIWFGQRLGPTGSLVIVSGILGVSITLLGIRVFNWYQFERQRRSDRQSASPIRREKLWIRSVDIYRSRLFSGTPFTGGVIRPYICIPEDGYRKFDRGELEAVIAHELGHIRQLDLLFTALIQALGDFFWFIPGYRWLGRKLNRLREIVADQSAVGRGTDPVLLASILVKLKEIPDSANDFILYSAFFREKPLLRTRIERLLGNRVEKIPRFGWQNLWFRWAMSLWIFTAVMRATFFGNHSTIKLSDPEWFRNMLKALGIY